MYIDLGTRLTPADTNSSVQSSTNSIEPILDSIRMSTSNTPIYNSTINYKAQLLTSASNKKMQSLNTLNITVNEAQESKHMQSVNIINTINKINTITCKNRNNKQQLMK